MGADGIKGGKKWPVLTVNAVESQSCIPILKSSVTTVDCNVQN